MIKIHASNDNNPGILVCCGICKLTLEACRTIVSCILTQKIFIVSTRPCQKYFKPSSIAHHLLILSQERLFLR
jgi:hypothetical protein